MPQETTGIDPRKMDVLTILGKQASCPCPVPGKKVKYLGDTGIDSQGLSTHLGFSSGWRGPHSGPWLSPDTLQIMVWSPASWQLILPADRQAEEIQGCWFREA